MEPGPNRRVRRLRGRPGRINGADACTTAVSTPDPGADSEDYVPFALHKCAPIEGSLDSLNCYYNGCAFGRQLVQPRPATTRASGLGRRQGARRNGLSGGIKVNHRSPSACEACWSMNPSVVRSNAPCTRYAFFAELHAASFA